MITKTKLILATGLGVVVLTLSSQNIWAVTTPSKNTNNSEKYNYDQMMENAEAQMNSALKNGSGQVNVSQPFIVKGAEEVYPFYTDPFVHFNMNIGQINPNQKEPPKPGSSLRLKLNVGFNSQAGSQAQNFLKDCKEKNPGSSCLNSAIYNLNRIGNTSIFAQIWRKDQNPNNAKKGDYLIDEFYVNDGTELLENQPKDFQFNWQIPGEVQPGDYYINFFLNANKSFDMWGTPLSVFSAGQIYNFSIPNQDGLNPGIELDKNNIKVNGDNYAYRLPAPTVTPGKDGNVKITIPVKNLDKSSQDIKAVYQLYSWSQTNSRNMVNSKEETKTLNSNGSTELTYTFQPNEKDSVYNLKVIVTGDNSKSTADIRMVIKGMNEGIFRYVGLVSGEDKKSYPMFCLRDAAWEGIFKGKVAILFTNNKGGKDQVWSQDVQLRPETRCFVVKDMPLESAICGKLTGKIFDASSNLVDNEEVNYSCSGAANLFASALNGGAGSEEELIKKDGLKKITEVILALIILIGLILMIQQFKSKNKK